MKYCDNKECEAYDIDEDNNCVASATIMRCHKVKPLTLNSDGGAEVTLDCRVMEPALDCLKGRIKELENDSEEASKHGNCVMEDLLGRTISSYKMAVDYLASKAS